MVESMEKKLPGTLIEPLVKIPVYKGMYFRPHVIRNHFVNTLARTGRIKVSPELRDSLTRYSRPRDRVTDSIVFKIEELAGKEKTYNEKKGGYYQVTWAGTPKIINSRRPVIEHCYSTKVPWEQSCRCQATRDSFTVVKKKLRTIPGCIENYTSLKKIFARIDDLELVDLHEEGNGSIKKVEEIDIHGGDLLRDISGIETIDGLRSLKISTGKGTDMSVLNRLPRLEKLELQSPLDKIDTRGMDDLKTLNVTWTGIKSVDDIKGIEDLGIEYLSIHGMDLDLKGIEKVKKLKRLHAGGGWPPARTLAMIQRFRKTDAGKRITVTTSK
jgi:hypothetical protein